MKRPGDRLEGGGRGGELNRQLLVHDFIDFGANRCKHRSLNKLRPLCDAGPVICSGSRKELKRAGGVRGGCFRDLNGFDDAGPETCSVPRTGWRVGGAGASGSAARAPPMARLVRLEREVCYYPRRERDHCYCHRAGEKET